MLKRQGCLGHRLYPLGFSHHLFLLPAGLEDLLLMHVVIPEMHIQRILPTQLSGNGSHNFPEIGLRDASLDP